MHDSKIPITQPERPSLEEALREIYTSHDSHWTSTLSTIGMTRVSRSAAQNAYMDDYYYR